MPCCEEFEATVEQDFRLKTNGEMSNQDLVQESKSRITTQIGTTLDDDIATTPLTITQKVEMLNWMRQFTKEEGKESVTVFQR